jgi:hypothetical protein
MQAGEKAKTPTCTDDGAFVETRLAAKKNADEM